MTDQESVTDGDGVHPRLPKSRDGIYPRCVWCNGENYIPAVLEYSAGTRPCASVYDCGRYLPTEYILHNEDDDCCPCICEHRHQPDPTLIEGASCVACKWCQCKDHPEYPFDQAVEDEMAECIREIEQIDDDRMREMRVAAFNKRYGGYLLARLNDEKNP